MSRKSVQNIFSATCTVCVTRSIIKTSLNEVIRVSKINKWLSYEDKVCRVLIFICPSCKKKGYKFG